MFDDFVFGSFVAQLLRCYCCHPFSPDVAGPRYQNLEPFTGHNQPFPGCRQFGSFQPFAAVDGVSDEPLLAVVVSVHGRQCLEHFDIFVAVVKVLVKQSQIIFVELQPKACLVCVGQKKVRPILPSSNNLPADTFHPLFEFDLLLLIPNEYHT